MLFLTRVHRSTEPSIRSEDKVGNENVVLDMESRVDTGIHPKKYWPITSFFFVTRIKCVPTGTFFNHFPLVGLLVMLNSR